MPRFMFLARALSMFFLALVAYGQQAPAASFPTPSENDFTLHNFHFKSGDLLPEVRMHYYTFGKPAKDSNGKTTNAVLVLHGTSGSGRQFLAPQFAGVLFGPGQLLDVNRYFVVLPDNIGHGKSSKPSDGLRAHFRNTITTTWLRRNTSCLKRGSASITSG